ncbi:MAG: ABC transporter permease [Bacillota bacterium]|nr:ABC transporter permease [Bacillota bacterium]
MYQFILRRLVWIPPLLLAVATCVFGILYLTPGDPAWIIAGENSDPTTVEMIRKQYGFDQPLPIQYVRFLGRLAQGDLGRSTQTRAKVQEELAVRFPVTARLAVGALAVTVVVGVPLGVVAAINQNGASDYLASLLAVFGASMPPFWLGLMLMLLFSVRLGWFPTVAEGSSFQDLLLPALVLAARPTAMVARLTRSEMLEVVRQDFVRTARAKGLHERVVVFKHALRNAVVPVVTMLGLQLGVMMGGAVVVEKVFALPGVGSRVVDGIMARDFPIVQGCLLVVATSFVLVNLIVDVAYCFINPRIRY